MSNEEKKKRADYQKKRLKNITIQFAIIVIVTILVVLSSLTYFIKNKDYYINYNENGEVKYEVNLIDDNFYTDEENKGNSYIDSTIDNIIVEFIYKINMDAEDVSYEYRYKIDALLTIVDKSSNNSLYNVTENIVEEKTLSQSSNEDLFIYEFITIDYHKYNDLAKEFITTYQLSNYICNVDIKADIYVVSNCDEFKNSNSNQYTMKLSIPLTNKIVSLTTSTSTNTQRQILSCNDENKDIYKYIAIISSSIDGLLIIALLVYILKSRNNDINYFIKVKKIMSNYRSFIQKINNDFDCLDFQQLHVNSFEEMLEIRDTILKPILMYENEDKTASRFYIPADNNLVYVFEIKVEPKIIETLEQLNEELNTSTLRKYKYSSKRRSFK